MRINSILTILLTCCLGWSFQVNAKEPIKIEILADANYPPYSFEKEGKAAGLYYDILNRVFSQLKGYDVSIAPITWQPGLDKIKNGESFAIYPPYYHPQVRPYIWPYSYPILEEKVVVICHEASKTNHKRELWPDDYIGLHFGLNAGFRLGGKRFWALVNEGKIDVMVAKDNHQNLLKLIRHEIDCYINDQVAIDYSLNGLVASKEITAKQATNLTLEVTVSRENGYLGFANQSHDFPFRDDFVKQFNAELARMRHNGEIEEMIRRYTQFNQPSSNKP